ncbi:hypothetical protein D3C84_1040620 [compost metagenome]
MLYFVKQPVRTAHLLDGGDERIHDFDFAVLTRTYDCPQLCLEQVCPVKADPDGTVAQERIIFFRQFEIVKLLVAADI